MNRITNDLIKLYQIKFSNYSEDGIVSFRFTPKKEIIVSIRQKEEIENE